jgi:hypothetical protein
MRPFFRFELQFIENCEQFFQLFAKLEQRKTEMPTTSRDLLKVGFEFEVFDLEYFLPSVYSF